MTRYIAAALLLLGLSALPAGAQSALPAEATIILQAATGVNCNAAGDTPIYFPAPWPYRIAGVTVVGETGSFSTATIGLFTAASGGGNQLIGQSALSGITTLSRNTAGNTATLTAPTATINAATLGTAYTLYLNVGTPQGGTCTFNLYLRLEPLANG